MGRTDDLGNDASITVAMSLLGHQISELQKVFSEEQLDALAHAGCMRPLNIVATLTAFLSDDHAEHSIDLASDPGVLLAKLRGFEKPSRPAQEDDVGLLARLLSVREKTRGLELASVSEAESLQLMIRELFAERQKWMIPSAVEVIDEEDKILVFAYSLEIIKFVISSIRYGGSVDLLRRLRDEICNVSVTEKRATVVGVVECALNDLRALWNDPKRDELNVDLEIGLLAHGVIESLVENHGYREFSALDDKCVCEILKRAVPGGRKAPGAAYIAAALSVQVGAFDDAIEPGESEEAACRRISNIFRNSMNAQRGRG